MSLLIQIIILLTRKRESEISFDIEESLFDLHAAWSAAFLLFCEAVRKLDNLKFGKVFNS